ncbi:MAG: class I SAM-dependent methyltransferase [Verrucomicrobia bacterium]|nr:class I SAM-dependent methyltransferase [Verrucomicrobiota bacterium]
MKYTENIDLASVREAYSGAEGRLWELIMGEQIHIGGFVSSMELAGKAGIGKGMEGVDFCSCNGAGMRFLVRYCGVESMTGVDATNVVINQCRERCSEEGLADKISCVKADVCDSRLPSDSKDFVWGEDAWCYVKDKVRLISEATRIVRQGGVIAFTDWIEGANGLTDAEAERFMQFMKFPNIQDMEGYKELLSAGGCVVKCAEDTGRFGPYVDLYLESVSKQKTYDVLKILGYNRELMAAVAEEMKFMQELAHAGKIAQGLFVAEKL